MATATITSGFTVLTSCDTNAAPNLVWTGGTVAIDAEFLKQGAAALSTTLRTVGLNSQYATLAGPTNLQNTHLRLWFAYAAPGKLGTQVQGGIRLYVYDGTNTGYWYLHGNDTYDGGWVLLQVNTAKSFDSGSCNLANVTRVGFCINITGTAPRNATNTWWDYLVHGPGYTVTGGTAGDPIKWSDVAAADKAAGYGVCRFINGVYALNSGITIGGTGADTYFSDLNQVAMFVNDPVATTLFKLNPVGGAGKSTTFNLTANVVKTAGPAWQLDLSSANLTASAMTGCTFGTGGGAIALKSGQSHSGNVFQGCGTIEANGAGLVGCSFSDHTADQVKVDSAAELAAVTGCKFTLGSPGTSNAIVATAAGDYGINGHTFTGYGADNATNAAFENATAGGTINLSTSNSGQNPTRYNSNGGTTNYTTQYTVTVNSLVTGSRVKVTRNDTQAVLYNDVESGGSCSFQTSYNGAVTIEARRATAPGPYYQPWVTVGTVGTGLTVTALQVLDQ